jgi:hypothetical protein
MHTHKSRMLAAFRGEEVDCLPYVPRLDLWYLANTTAGTMPKQYAGVPMNDIARAEGWAFHHRFCDDQLAPEYRPLYLHRGINVFYSRDTVFDVVLPKDVEAYRFPLPNASPSTPVAVKVMLSFVRYMPAINVGVTPMLP